MKVFKILSILFIAFLFTCNKIDIPLKKQNNTCGIDTDTTHIRKILVADYTGHKCVNCPQAAEILHEIKNKYCDHVIPIAIHVSNFASPSNEPFDNDYRTLAGTELDDFFKVSNQGLPNGLINRKNYGTNSSPSYIVSKDNWETKVNLIFNIPPDVDISIQSSYDENTNKVTATISAEFLYDIDYKLNIGLYVTEDSIISAQMSLHGIIENYIHRHMLRKSISGAFGENFVSNASEGDIINKSYTFHVNEEWDINHCELVAFISNRETKEIIQAESEHIIH